MKEETKNPPTPRKRGSSGTRAIPRDWSPSRELVAKLVEKHGLRERDVLSRVDPFRDYWLSTGKAKADWEATFRVWIGREVDRGDLQPEPYERLERPIEPPDTRTPEEREAASRWLSECLAAVTEGRTPPPAPGHEAVPA